MKRTYMAAATVLATLAACTPAESGDAGVVKQFAAGSPAESPAATLREVTITARDFAFDAPDTLAAGPTVIRLVNQGPEMHHVALARLDEGKNLQDVMDALAAGPSGPPPAWLVEVGGPNAPGTVGGESRATLDLAPGTYALLCWIPSPDGTPHVMKGMAKQVVVVPAAGPAAPLAPAELEMELSDYAYTLSAPITAGTRTLRVTNSAQQSHEVLFVRLAPGRTAAEMAKFLEKPAGTPPGTIVGGTTGMAKGLSNQLTIDFTPGEYALLCFLPDAGDGKPHVAHGMIQQITVS